MPLEPETNFLLFHPGKQHSPQTALALQQLGRLRSYATSIFYDRQKFPYFLERLPGKIGQKLHSEFTRFEHPEINPSLVRTWGTLEWLERLALRLGSSKLSYRLDRIGNDRFARGLDAEISSDARFALWGYNGSAGHAFRLAKDHNRICVLDRTIGDFRYFNRIMEEQASLYPQFFTQEEKSVEDKRIDLDDEEYDLADKILVGSDFCRRTLVENSPIRNLDDKIVVLPYCCNNHDFTVAEEESAAVSDGPLKFLFVGRITPRKGIHLLLEAIAKFDKSEATLTLLGKMLIPEPAFQPFADRVTHLQSVAPTDVARVMKQHHILVLPSFFEGSAITLLEALSCGMAVIQSPQAGNGATDSTGLVLEANTVEHLSEALQLAINNRGLVESWRKNARIEALRYSFESYRDNIAAILPTF